MLGGSKKASKTEKQSKAWSKTSKQIKETIRGCFYFYSISLLPLICGRTVPFLVGKLSHIRVHAKAIQRDGRDLHHPQNTIYLLCGHAPICAIEGAAAAVIVWRPTPPPQALQIDPPTLSPCTISASTGIRFSLFSQPPLPACYFSGSKQDGLQWRAPCNLSLTISIWQLLWIPTAEWKGQKPWLCWGGRVPLGKHM